MISLQMKNIREALRNAILLAPVEIGVSVFYYVVALADYAKDGNLQEWISSFPLCFAFIYGMNKWTKETRMKLLYYFSGVSIAGFWWWNLSLDSTLYWITLIVSHLWVILAGRAKDNPFFVPKTLRYVLDYLVAVALALLSWLIGMGILYSVRYIFDFSYPAKNCIVYPEQIAWFLIAPLTFLMFNTRDSRTFTAGRFLNILMNFILSPALVIYNVILYLYFIKISCLWSLPKGGIAYMVLAFFSLLLLGKMVQPVLRHHYFSWYYRYFSIWVFLPLVMLWISLGYRVGEYGWTEWRVYLALIGGIASVSACLLAFPGRQQYRRVAWLLAGGLSVLSYIPGITAEDLGVYSQNKRAKEMLAELYPSREWKTGTDSVTVARYHILENSLKYVKRVKGDNYLLQHYGFYLQEVTNHVAATEGCNSNFTLYWQTGKSVDISRFKEIKFIRNYYDGSERFRSDLDGGRFVLMRERDTLIDMDINRQFRKKLVEAGIDTTSVLSKERLLNSEVRFWEYEADDKIVLFESLNIDGCKARIEHVNPLLLLLYKKKTDK